jgi:predicted ATP-binding protein involved in virulence
MRIKEIIINGLFGMFNHVIPLNLDDHITILTGPNGFGKTTILKLISILFSHQSIKLYGLFNIDFKDLQIIFENNTYLTIEKEDNHEKISFKYFEGLSNESLCKSSLDLYSEEIFDYAQLIADRYPFIAPVRNQSKGGRLTFNTSTRSKSWLDNSKGAIIQSEELLETYGELLQDIAIADKPPEILAMLDKINVNFIETQRLFRLSPIDNSGTTKKQKIDVVEAYSEHLSEEIQKKLAEFGEESQKLDSTFPERLLDGDFRILNQEEILRKLTELDERRQRLMKLGLLDSKEAVFKKEKIDEKQIIALTLYASDNFKKLSIFDTIADKIEILRDIINKHFIYKKLSINKDKGFVFINDNNQILMPTDLSSGEQHQLIMLYELLFRVAPNSVILIDEPELSLHVAWQMQILDDLERIAGQMQFDIIVATHSPQIINDRWDLTVELKGKPYG